MKDEGVSYSRGRKASLVNSFQRLFTMFLKLFKKTKKGVPEPILKETKESQYVPVGIKPVFRIRIGYLNKGTVSRADRAFVDMS